MLKPTNKIKVHGWSMFMHKNTKFIKPFRSLLCELFSLNLPLIFCINCLLGFFGHLIICHQHQFKFLDTQYMQRTLTILQTFQRDIMLLILFNQSGELSLINIKWCAFCIS